MSANLRTFAKLLARDELLESSRDDRVQLRPAVSVKNQNSGEIIGAASNLFIESSRSGSAAFRGVLPIIFRISRRRSAGTDRHSGENNQPAISTSQ
jgi:hypothetical protein